MQPTPEDIVHVHDYLIHTPEGPLKKILVGNDFTDPHFRLLIKLAKGADKSTFVDCFINENFGQLRLNAKELPLKDGFWPVCKKKIFSLGLIQTQKAS